MPPLLLLLLLACYLRLPAPAFAACSPKTCGDVNISYPFWLEEPGRPACGSPSFQLNCSGGQAFLSRSMYGKYQVARVFAENSSFVAVDHNLRLATGCPAPWFNISLGIGLGPFVISKSNRELLFLFNCTERQQAAPEGFARTACRNESYFQLGQGYGAHREYREKGVVLPPACRLSVVPVLGFPGGGGGGYAASMSQGFLLQWTVASDDCPKCEASGGQCRYGSSGMGFSCNCSGDVFPEKCGELRKINRTDSANHGFA